MGLTWRVSSVVHLHSQPLSPISQASWHGDGCTTCWRGRLAAQAWLAQTVPTRAGKVMG